MLESIRRFRERKVLPAPVLHVEVGPALGSARVAFTTLERAARNLRTREDCKDAIGELGRLRRSLEEVKQALEERLEGFPMEELAVSLAADA